MAREGNSSHIQNKNMPLWWILLHHLRLKGTEIHLFIIFSSSLLIRADWLAGWLADSQCRVIIIGAYLITQMIESICAFEINMTDLVFGKSYWLEEIVLYLSPWGIFYWFFFVGTPTGTVKLIINIASAATDCLKPTVTTEATTIQSSYKITDFNSLLYLPA